MDIALVGGGPGLQSVEGFLEPVDVETRRTNAGEIDEFDVAIVRGEAGAMAFERANLAALAGETTWFAIEVGGVGGHTAPAIGVAGFKPGETGCYRCLSARIEAAANIPAMSSDEGDQTDEPSAAETASAPGEERYAGALLGRELLRLLHGGASTLLGGVIDTTRDDQVRELVSVPHCLCGDPPAMFTLSNREPWTDERFVDQARRVVDDRVGPVTGIEERASYPVSCCVADLAAIDPFSDGSTPERITQCGETWTEAVARTLQSALGVYCGNIFRTDQFVTGNPDTLELAVDPAAFVERTETEPDDQDWILGRRLHDGCQGHLPADLVYRAEDRNQVGPPIGTGRGTAGAMLPALYETVATDAAMLSWYSTHDPPGLDIDDERFHRVATRAGAEGLSVTPLVVTQDVDIPVVAVAVTADAWPRACMGLAANLDPGTAARSALLDALTEWHTLSLRGPEDTLAGCGRYAEEPDLIHELIDTPRTVDDSTIEPDTVPSGFEEFLAVVDRIRTIGDPYGVRLTTADMATLDIEVGTVLVPGAQPLVGDDGPVGTRAREVPVERDEKPRLDRQPHPYPLSYW